MSGTTIPKKGLKFLDPSLCTEYMGERTSFIPALTGWMEHPEPGVVNGQDCGKNGWHIMLKCSAIYAPNNWWPWHAKIEGVLGFSSEKARATKIVLRPIPPKLWWRYLRRFGNGANLRGANLQEANLQETNLRGANLRGTNLQEANLCGADLRWANLRGTNLRGTNLRWANLQEAIGL